MLVLKEGRVNGIMKKWLSLAMAIVLFLLPGCRQNSGERQTYDYYTVSDGDSDIAALLFLGGKDQVEASTTALKEAYFSALPGQWPENVESVETDEWQEAYLLLPKYPGTVISVSRLDEEEQLAGELLSTEHPVLLQCNRSDVMPSTEVTITYQERTVTFRPHISLEDGSCVAADGIYTETIQ